MGQSNRVERGGSGSKGGEQGEWGAGWRSGEWEWGVAACIDPPVAGHIMPYLGRLRPKSTYLFIYLTLSGVPSAR